MALWSRSKGTPYDPLKPDRSAPDHFLKETSRRLRGCCVADTPPRLQRVRSDLLCTSRQVAILCRRNLARQISRTYEQFQPRSGSTLSDRDCPTRQECPTA